MAAWCAPLELARPVVISPHFDDAVLSCGQLLSAHPGAVVITVTGGERAAGWSQATEWDALAGFGPGEDVVAQRRREDAAALASLGARGRWLEVPDQQYGAGSPDPQALAGQLGSVLAAEFGPAGPGAVLLPMGLANPDHVLTHDAALLLRAGAASAETIWLGYAEAGYLHIPGLLAWRLGQLVAAGITPTPAPLPVPPGGLAAKQAAVRCYRSQLRALGEDWGYAVDTTAAVAESFWRLQG